MIDPNRTAAEVEARAIPAGALPVAIEATLVASETARIVATAG